MKLLEQEQRQIQQWVKKIQKRGNDVCANLLIEKYYDEIYIYAYKQTFSRETALDLTQDIFISMLLSIERYDMKKASFRTWLYRIATNKIIDHKRTYRDFIPLQDIEIPIEIDYPTLITDKELAEKIESYISTLPTDRQEIFRLKIFAEYTFTQIAETVQKPENTVKAVYYRLLAQLRKEFENEYTDDK